MCGAAGTPSARISSTVSSVPSRVEPPAPNVTEQNAGSSCASCRRAARSFSTPSGVRGGKNSRL
jgi:bacterioferritin-associated ferredoxin